MCLLLVSLAHARDVVLVEADRAVFLFGPWPAARRRVGATGSLPASAIGVTVDDPRWEAAGAVAAQVGVRQIPWEGAEARSMAALLPPEPPVPPGASRAPPPGAAWADLPRTDPWSLGRLACGAVLRAVEGGDGGSGGA